jgi:hypothetical protein
MKKIEKEDKENNRPQKKVDESCPSISTVFANPFDVENNLLSQLNSSTSENDQDDDDDCMIIE